MASKNASGNENVILVTRSEREQRERQQQYSTPPTSKAPTKSKQRSDVMARADAVPRIWSYHRRCANFGTCTGDEDGSPITGSAQVNADLLELFAEGQTNLIDGNCDSARDVKDKIVDLITVPLVQGVLRYAWYARKSAGISSLVFFFFILHGEVLLFSPLIC